MSGIGAKFLNSAPSAEIANVDGVGGAGVGVADLRGEEFEDAEGGARAGIGEQCRYHGFRVDDRQLFSLTRCRQSGRAPLIRGFVGVFIHWLS